MNIDIKEIQNILYTCNVNFYFMYVNTEDECIDIEMNENIENIDIEPLLDELNNIFDEIDFEEFEMTIRLYFNDQI